GDALREALEDLLAARAAGSPPRGNPYRGLLAFEAEHRSTFFGRGPEVRAVVDRLRAEPIVVVTGDSGVGKSSLCRAGVIPAVLEADIDGKGRGRVITFVPGRHPLGSLAATA